jgi:Cdc6-like AAA superfamily ATPase
MSLIKREKNSGWLIPRFAEYFGMSKVDFDDAQEMSAEIIRQLDDLCEEKRKLVIMIDAVEHIGHEEALEEIHALLGLQALITPCISFVLIGTEEFKRVLDRSILSGRLNFKVKIPPLTFEELNEYMINQLNRAGLKLGTFNSYAIKELYSLSGGVYSLVNAIAENCLMEAYSQNKKIVGPEMVAKAAEYVLSDDQGQANAEVSDDEEDEREVTSSRAAPLKNSETRERPNMSRSPQKQRETDGFDRDEMTKSAPKADVKKPLEDKPKPQILDAENLKNIKLSQLFKKGEAS